MNLTQNLTQIQQNLCQDMLRYTDFEKIQKSEKMPKNQRKSRSFRYMIKFKGAYQRINDYFSEIATLLNASDLKEDKLYKTAFKRFKPLEINGINLGFSESKHGAAFGEMLFEKLNSTLGWNLLESIPKIV